MADESKSSDAGLKKADTALSKLLPPSEIPPEANADYAVDAPDRIVPKKGDDGYETPSGHALAKVGEFKGDPVEDQVGAKAHGLRYLAEKMKLRWGYGVDS